MTRSLLVAATLLATATAQVGTLLDPAKLPQCALQCANLNAAAAVCVPPATPATNQATYQNCFCQSGYLGSWRTGAVTGVCDAECAATPSDLTKAQQWYVGLCQSGAVVTPGGAAAATGTSTSSGAGSTGGSSSSSNSSSGHKSWIDTHYRWIILVIVLLLAGLAAIFLLLWLKRRHDRKWALGGGTRESMLTHEHVANSLSNRHPDAPGSVSQVHLPQSRGYNEMGMMSGGMAEKAGPVAGVLPQRSESRLKKKGSGRSKNG